MQFENRYDAGIKLAEKLMHLKGENVIILGLPRGGIPVAHEVAKALGAPLDVFIVRKLGVPGHEELAMGAIASGGVRVLNEDVLQRLRIPDSAINEVAERELEELRRREESYRGSNPPPDLRDRRVILVDDGLATGSTMRAAAKAVRQQGAAEIIVAVPTASPDVCEEFREEVDDVYCAFTPEPFHAVGAWYEDFAQTSDVEVQRILRTTEE